MENRTELLLGSDVVEVMRSKKIIVFGVGGVGSWCVESLARSGFGHITMVDFDRVAASNINRQLPALHSTVGRLKVDVMRERVLDINPDAEVVAQAARYTAETAGDWNLADYDYVIDAIDSVPDKALLILNACKARPAVLFSSMGAALKSDPGRVSVAEFWKVKGCPLGAALRRRFKKSGVYPAHKFQCVYSDELLANRGEQPPGERVNGTLAHMTAIFGLTLASLVVKREMSAARG